MKKMFIALTALCAAFTACGDKTPSSSTLITVDGRIDVRSAVMVLPDDSGQMVENKLPDGSTIRVRQRSFDSTLAIYQYTDQTSAIDLSPIEGALTLQDAAQCFGPEVLNCKISNDKARFGEVVLVAYTPWELEVGDLILTDAITQKAMTNSSFSIVLQLYSTQRTTIIGQWKEEGLIIKMNLDLRKGWNDIVSTISFDEQTQSAKMTCSTTLIAKESLHWKTYPLAPEMPPYDVKNAGFDESISL